MPDITQLDRDLIVAMKAGDTLKRDVLRGLKSALTNYKIETSQEVTAENSVFVLQREAKRRRESIEAFKLANKPDLVEIEQQELALIEEYLPKQLDEQAITLIIEQLQTDQPQLDFATGMRELSAKLKGHADMRLVSELLKQKLH